MFKTANMNIKCQSLFIVFNQRYFNCMTKQLALFLILKNYLQRAHTLQLN